MDDGIPIRVTIEATDPDASEKPQFSRLNYTIVSSNDTSNRFSLDSVTGMLTAASMIYNPLNVSSNYFGFRIAVTDAGGLSTVVNVVVYLSNTNQLPRFSDRTLSLPENVPQGTLLVRFNASDLVRFLALRPANVSAPLSECVSISVRACAHVCVCLHFQDVLDLHTAALYNDIFDSVGLPVFEISTWKPRQVINDVVWTFWQINVSTGSVNFERMAVRNVRVQVLLLCLQGISAFAPVCFVDFT